MSGSDNRGRPTELPRQAEPIFPNEDQVSAQAIIKAEVDLQISTAKRYPRSIAKSTDNAVAMATRNQETAQSCFYTLKRKEKDGKIKFIEGPSIRCAEIVASCWGNLRWGSRVIGEDEKFVTTQGVCHDLETNVSCSVDIRRRITTRDGYRYGDDMIMTTTNAASAIARRNALNSVVPKIVIDEVWRSAKKTAVGEAKTHGQRLADAISAFGKMHVSVEQLLEYLDKPNGRIEDIDGDDLLKLRGVFNAIRDEETTIDAEFPPKQEGPPQPTDGKTAFGFKTPPVSGTISGGTTGEQKQPEPKTETATSSAAETQGAPPQQQQEPEKEPEKKPEQQEPSAIEMPDPCTWDWICNFASEFAVSDELGLNEADIKQQLNLMLTKPWMKLSRKDQVAVFQKLKSGGFAFKAKAAAEATA